MNLLKKISFPLVIFLSSYSSSPAEGEKITREYSRNLMRDVQKWTDVHYAEIRPGTNRGTQWPFGAWCAGVMAAYKTTGDKVYFDSAMALAKRNNWKLGDRQRHAMDHAIGQTYLDIYSYKKDPKMMMDTKRVFDKLVAENVDVPFANIYYRELDSKGEWSWADTLFMSPPTLIKLYRETGDKKYLDFMNRKWWKATDFLYDKEEHLFYRDSSYFKKREKNGKKVFWGRGNGWVMGGIVLSLQGIPKDYRDHSRYVKLLQEMSEKMAEIQQPDGFWRASLLDPDSYPGGESSATGFITFSIAWGINHGHLDRERYLPVVLSSWKALTQSVSDNGKIGWVQPPGDGPARVKYDQTEVYGTGAFLLAGSEMLKLLEE